MKVLFIGGTGNISSACSRLALKNGFDLYLLNRGTANRHPLPEGAKVINANIRNPGEVSQALAGHAFDVVVDWIAFTVEDIQADIDLFQGRVKQFIFISSASAYQKPPSHPVITESTPLRNPHWEYSRNKIACEEMLNSAYRDQGFPITIVRPSHTYDTVIPVAVGNWDYTIADRMLRGKPIIVHGDGTSLWTMTHSEDFAKGFVGLLGHQQALGHSFHITSDEVLTWNQIYQSIGDAVGVTPDIIHIPSDFIARFDPNTGCGLLGDKAHCGIFDNSKIKQFVPGFSATIPFSVGIRKSVAWFQADTARQAIDQNANEAMDRIIAAYTSLPLS